MWRYIEKIRSRSNTEKRIFAFNVSFIITAIIFIIWLGVTFYTFDISDGDTEAAGPASPVSSIISSIKNMFGFER